MIAHFSACRYLFKGHALHLERERIRSSMGALRIFGDCWPLGKRTYREMGIIAREVLGLAEADIPRSLSPPRQFVPVAPSPPSPQGTTNLVADVPLDISLNDFDFQLSSQDLLGAFTMFRPSETPNS